MDFEYRSFPNQVYFGDGKISILDEIVKNFKKVLLIAEDRLKPQVEPLKAARPAGSVVHISNVIQHVPETLVKEAQETLEKENPGVLVSIGGGSSVGLAKALARETHLPIVAVPTTFAGSEQTNIWGITTEGGKTTGRSDWVLPRVVIYDPSLTLTMPKPLAVTSAMNAMAHLMEAIYSPTGNPITRHHSLLGIEKLKKGLQEIARNEALTHEANENILFGAYLAGKSLCEVSMSLHHKVAHVLGGIFGLDHARVHTVLQSYVLSYQWPHLTSSIQKDFQQVLGEDPAHALKDLAARAGGPTTLESIGFKRHSIDEAVDAVMAKPYDNPAPITKEGITGLLTHALEGTLMES